MKITKELLETICLRGENLNKKTKIEKILNSCLRSSINGFDFDSFSYDEKNEQEAKKMNLIAVELKEKHNLHVYFDGDEGRMQMFVCWY